MSGAARRPDHSLIGAVALGVRVLPVLAGLVAAVATAGIAWRLGGDGSALRAGLSPGGLLIMATFAPDGPDRCSGLPVTRYAPQDLLDVLGEGFTCLGSWREDHPTPGGAMQPFTWVALRSPLLARSGKMLYPPASSGHQILDPPGMATGYAPGQRPGRSPAASGLGGAGLAGI